MTKVTQPGGPEKKRSKQVSKDKDKARIGFLESMGDSGYDNRTDPNYCYDVLRKFIKGKELDEEALE